MKHQDLRRREPRRQVHNHKMLPCMKVLQAAFYFSIGGMAAAQNMYMDVKTSLGPCFHSFIIIPSQFRHKPLI